MKKYLLKARHAYKESGDDNIKNLLADIFGRDELMQDITKLVTTFEAACEYMGENPNDEKFKEGDDSDIAFKRCKVCAKSWKEGKIMSYTSGERMWYPVLQYVAGVGFRFCYANDDSVCAFAPGGAALFETREKAQHAARAFTDTFKRMMPTNFNK